MKKLIYTAAALFATTTSHSHGIGHNEITSHHVSDDPSVCHIHNVFRNAHIAGPQMGSGTLIKLDDTTPPRFVLTAKHVFAKQGKMDQIQEVDTQRSYGEFNGRRIKFKSISHHPSTDLSIIELEEDLNPAHQVPLQFERPTEHIQSRSVGTGNYRHTHYQGLFNISLKQQMHAKYVPLTMDPLAEPEKDGFCLSVGKLEDFVTAHHFSPLHPWAKLPERGLPMNCGNGFCLPGDSGGKIENEKGELYAVIDAHSSGNLDRYPVHVETSIGLLIHRFEDWIRSTLASKTSS